MTETFLALPTHLRRRLAQALESGLLPSSCSEAALRSAMSLHQDVGDVLASLGELERLGQRPAGPLPKWNDRRVLIFTENREGTKRAL